MHSARRCARRCTGCGRPEERIRRGAQEPHRRFRRSSGEELRRLRRLSGADQERIRRGAQEPHRRPGRFRKSGSDQEERSASGPGALVGDSSAGEAHERREKRPHWRPWIGSWLRVPRRPLSRRAGVAARPLRPSRRPFSAHWNWPRGQSRSSLARPWNRSLSSRLRWSLGPSSWPRTREVAIMLDTLKSEVEGEGENSSHCENTKCHCENTLNESSADAEPKRLMRPRWPRCSGGSCRIMRHGPWGGWQQLSSAASSAMRRAATSAHRGRAVGRAGQWHRAAGPTEMPMRSGTEPLTPMGANRGPPKFL